MGTFSDYLELEILDHITGVGEYSSVATVYLALCTADPTDAGTGATISEPPGTYTTYARQSIAFDAAAARSISNTATVTFPQADGAGGTITHYAICDALTVGNMLAHGSLAVSKGIVNGNTPSVAAGEVDISFDANEVSDYLANIVLDFAFRNQVFAQPTIWVGLSQADLTDTATGTTVVEPSGLGHVRKAHSAWTTAAAGATQNTGIITFASPTSSWSTITATVLFDDSAAGNVLFYDNGTTEQTPDSGDTVQFADGAFDVTLD